MKNTDIEVGTLVKHKHYDFEGIVVGHEDSTQVVIQVTDGEPPCTENDGTYIAHVTNVEVLALPEEVEVIEVIEEVEMSLHAVEMEMNGMTVRFAHVEDAVVFMLSLQEGLN
ncbi:hypothetical protein [Bacillus thuringiensis]|uniref:hypothetical protein n=1 Tax=Bacillus thuringiensis TaxID=1428 RepID=UPI003459B581